MFVNSNLNSLTVQLSDSADLTAGLGHPRAPSALPSARPCPLLLHLNVVYFCLIDCSTAQSTVAVFHARLGICELSRRHRQDSIMCVQYVTPLLKDADR